MIKTGKEFIPDSLRQSVYARDGHKCCYCGSADFLSIDHIYPEAEGGDLDHRNLATCCRQCNSRKGSASVSDFLNSGYMRSIRASWDQPQYERVIDRLRDASEAQQARALLLQSECLSRFGRSPSVPGLDEGEVGDAA